MPVELNIYSYKFNGVNPVGAVALVIAKDRVSAKKQLVVELERRGLGQEISLEDFIEYPTFISGTYVLLDGNY